MNNYMHNTSLIGCDEVGYGALAGPVVAAMVLLRDMVDDLNDSKALSPIKRRSVYKNILSSAYIGIGVIGPRTIEKKNILQATLLAMSCAHKHLTGQLKKVSYLQKNNNIHIIIDGLHSPHLPYPTTTLVKADQKIPSVMAASIVAKVFRDTMMIRLHPEYEVYDFASNKGYGTAKHLLAIRNCGVTSHHRLTFLRNVIK